MITTGNQQLITLTTDFGLSDGFVGVIKGVILSKAPGTELVDISHDIQPWDLRAANWVLRNAYTFFPPHTVHLCVVDPGVGSPRKPIVIETQRGKFIGPDNGVFSFVFTEEAEFTAYELTDEEFWLNPVSNTFHARDIYAPVAAHLVLGTQPRNLGPLMKSNSLVRIAEPRLVNLKGWMDGEVVYEDRFGNLITNIPSQMAKRNGACLLEGRAVGHLTRSYSSVQSGEVAIINGSHGCVEISVYQGRASKILGAGVGSAVRMEAVS